MNTSKPVILTGLRANNELHIGNYFGALLPLVNMARSRAGDYQVDLMLADLHSFTTPIDHAGLQAQIRKTLKMYVAAGLPLDEQNVHLFRQSYMPAHSELAWILSCFTGMGEMSRMTQFKDKSSKVSADRINVGLFGYPILMACDYLLYGASYIPVGDDQSQHLEFGRDIAERMNRQFGQLFVVPEPVHKQHEFFGKNANGQGLRIKDLIDPSRKMSKSDESGKGVIFLGDSPQLTTKKIMGATTDSVGAIHLDPQNQPGIANLLQISALLSGKSVATVAAEWEGNSAYGTFKSAVAEQVASFLEKFQTQLHQIDDAQLQSKLELDEVELNLIADDRLYSVQTAVGLR